MYSETKKLYLIEELLKVESDVILAEIEIVLAKSRNELPQSNSFTGIMGELSLADVNELERNIHDGCEQINENDWN